MYMPILVYSYPLYRIHVLWLLPELGRGGLVGAQDLNGRVGLGLVSDGDLVTPSRSWKYHTATWSLWAY